MSKPSSYFDRTYIINLPERTDRRREVISTLSKSGFSLKDGNIEVFPAIKPNETAGFPSIGARGCFLSHLAVLKKAYGLKFQNILILEDDVEFANVLTDVWPTIKNQLIDREWSFAYFGYCRVDEATFATENTGTVEMRQFSGGVGCTHAYAVNSSVLSPLIKHLEKLLNGKTGDRKSGPMHVDGALSIFRENHPEALTLIAEPQIAWQRASHSDIHTTGFRTMKVIRLVLKPARGVKNLLRQYRS